METPENSLVNAKIEGIVHVLNRKLKGLLNQLKNVERDQELLKDPDSQTRLGEERIQDVKNKEFLIEKIKELKRIRSLIRRTFDDQDSLKIWMNASPMSKVLGLWMGLERVAALKSQSPITSVLSPEEIDACLKLESYIRSVSMSSEHVFDEMKRLMAWMQQRETLSVIPFAFPDIQNLVAKVLSQDLGVEQTMGSLSLSEDSKSVRDTDSLQSPSGASRARRGRRPRKPSRQLPGQ